MELSEFLLARIAIAEEVVRQYQQAWDEDESSPWHPYTIEKEGPYLSIDPAFVLAECAAKRRIVELHSDLDSGGYCRVDDDAAPCPTLRALALPHVDHPDYRDEWKP